MNAKYILTLLATLLLFLHTSNAQTSYLVYFTNKPTQNLSTTNPKSLLSPRAIQRRAHHGVPLDSLDLPVSSNYLAQVKQLGITIRGVSKWLNAFGTQLTPQQYELLQQQPFIKNIQLLKKVGNQNASTHTSATKKVPENKFDYGDAFTQASLIKTTELHNRNYTGAGMHIAVLDAGFFRVNDLPCFEDLRQENRILDKYDFVDRDTSHYDMGYHGMMVLSTMAAKQKGKFVGTAPDAYYYLYRTEDGDTESRLEELNWVLAAERADSIGVDLINSSLGYSDFDEPVTDYTHDDLDGVTSISSRAAGIASSKGIIVVISAGNSGSDKWLRITPPSDAHNIIAVGATYSNGKPCSFSSEGYTSDHRVKPDLLAMGSSVLVQGSKGNLTYSDGTSFASPITCGSIACLWQAYPESTNTEIMRALRLTAANYTTPSTKTGYGLANLSSAYSFLFRYSYAQKNNQFFFHPKHLTTHTTFYHYSSQPPIVEIRDALTNKKVTGFHTENLENNTIQLNNDHLQPGVYRTRIKGTSINGYIIVLPKTTIE